VSFVEREAPASVKRITASPSPFAERRARHRRDVRATSSVTTSRSMTTSSSFAKVTSTFRRRELVEVHDLAVEADAHEALRAEVLDDDLVRDFARELERRGDVEPCARRQRRRRHR
jgi:hypothetical protein